VRVELMDDVPVRCSETGEQVVLKRGRIVVIEENALPGPAPQEKLQQDGG